jgi:streptogramin lyase
MALTTLGFVLAVPPAQAAVKIDEFGTPTSDSGPVGITMGPDGNVWFTEYNALNIGQLTPSKVPVFNYEFPVAAGNPRVIVPGSDGNLWFVEPSSIGRITPAGILTEFPDPNNPIDITPGPDGNLWFIEGSVGCGGNGTVGRITTSGIITDFSFPTCPHEISAGPDGNLWLTAFDQNIYRMDSSGSITGVFPVNSCQALCLGLGDITAGPDGNLWFLDQFADPSSSIGKITTSGVITEYPSPNVNTTLDRIAPGPCGGGLWFTEEDFNQVGQITTSGVITEYPVPTEGSEPQGITLGPDGNVWFTESSTSQLGRVDDLFFHILCVSNIAGNVFLPGTIKGGQGRPVGWLMLNPGTHGIVDASGMGLFGSQDALPLGEVYSFAFTGAGTYAYDDPFDLASGGRVRVPITVQFVPGTLDQAQVTWASADPPPGFVFDVQVKQPGSRTGLSWMTGVSSLTAVFGPGDPLWVGSGTYCFRSRIRNTANGAASGYSPQGCISLTQLTP